MRTFLRSTYYVVGTLLFLLIALAGFTQTKLFRSYLHDRIVTVASTLLHGELSLGPVQGNLITGFQVDSVTFIESGETVLQADRVEASYEPLEFFVRRVTVNSVKLVNPRIVLVRGLDSVWNINRVAPPSSTESKPFQLALNFKKILISNAEVVLRDSVKLLQQRSGTSGQLPSTIADYPVLTLYAVNLAASATVSSKGITATVQQLAFTAAEPAFTLVHLSGEILLSPTESRITKLSMETPESRLTASAQLKNADLLAIHNISELEQKPVNLTLSVGRLSFTDVKKFFPADLNFLDREVGVQLKVSGTLGKLHVENLVAQSPHSYIKLEGMVGNVLKPAELELDLVCVNNKIDPNEIRKFFPRLSMPDLHGVGELTYNLRFTGKPSAFTVHLEGASKAGHVELLGTLEERNKTIAYNATLKTSQLDLGLVLNNGALASSIQGVLAVKGSGTTWEDLNGNARLDIDSSQFYGSTIAKSHMEASVAERAANVNIQLGSGRTNILLSGSSRLSEKGSYNYRLDSCVVSSLNLASILKKRRYESDLSFTATAEGSGKNLDEHRTTFNLLFSPSSYHQEDFKEGWLRAELNAADPVRQTFHLTSNIADLSIEGKFTLTSFISTLEKSGILIAEAIEHRVHSLDSLRSTTHAQMGEQKFQSSIQTIPDPVAARFDITVKNLYPFGVFLGTHLAGKGTISGEVAGSLDELQLSGKTRAGLFQYADSSVTLGLSDAALAFNVQGISRTSILDSVRADITLASTHVALNNTLFYQPDFSVKIRGTSGTFDVHALIDSTLGISASGASLYEDGFISYTLSRFQFDAQSYQFINVEPVVVRLGSDGLAFEHFWVRHDAQELKATGILELYGNSGLELEATNFSLENLKLFSLNKSFIQDVRDFGGVVHGRATLRGNMEQPDLSLTLAAHNVQYGQTPIGQLEARGSYLNRLLNLDISLRSKPDDPTVTPDFLISGTLPYDLAIKKSSDQPLSGEMDVSIQSKGLRLELIDPFINELSNLTGVMVCDMKMRGTVEQPRYEGSMSFQSAQFLFRSLGITYRLEGQLKPAGDRIALENIAVQNIATDRTDGLMRFSGSLSLQGLKLKEFDLQGNGQLLVMKESARQPGQSIFGDLFAATGTNGLRWSGTPQRSVLSGDLRVKSANLTLPPTREQLLRTAQDVTITVVNDTAVASTSDKSGGQVLAMNGMMPVLAAGAKPSIRPDTEKDERSFLDRLVYDLDIETQGPTQVRFIFNPYIGEELFADLKGRMSFNKDGKQTRLIGEVEVGDRSYYNFLKRFQARGKLTFTGDALNPELNVRAQYESVHRAGGDTTRNSSLGQTTDKRVIVILDINGTRKEPKPSFSIEEIQPNGEHLASKSGDVESDAISFILTGSFRDELTQQERSTLLGSNMIYGLTSSVLSGPITDFIRKEFGFISSVDVIYYGGSVQSSTDVRVTSEIGEAVIRLGGRVLNDIGNANASVQLPLAGVLGSEKWRNLILEVERRVEGVESYQQRRESNGLRLIYRISF